MGQVDPVSKRKKNDDLYFSGTDSGKFPYSMIEMMAIIINCFQSHDWDAAWHLTIFDVSPGSKLIEIG